LRWLLETRSHLASFWLCSPDHVNAMLGARLMCHLLHVEGGGAPLKAHHLHRSIYSQ
jgi:hypothetical protein